MFAHINSSSIAFCVQNKKFYKSLDKSKTKCYQKERFLVYFTDADIGLLFATFRSVIYYERLVLTPFWICFQFFSAHLSLFLKEAHALFDFNSQGGNNESIYFCSSCSGYVFHYKQGDLLLCLKCTDA